MNDNTGALPPLWKIWRNPLIWRYARSRLRWKRTLFWVLLVGILTTFCSLITYLPATQRAMIEPTMAARWIFGPILVIQGIVLLLMGTGSVASGMVDERLSGALDYQRMAPLSPAHKIVGYLFGLPIREYLLFAITLPFVAFATVRGGIPVHEVVIVYLLFWTSAMLYHFTAMAAGMVVQRWRMASRLTQLAIILLYLVLPQLSQLNIFIFESLTVRPAIAEHLGPYLIEAGWGTRTGMVGAFGERLVPVFNYSVSQTWFSLFLQGGLMSLFFVMLLRKWVRDHHHPLNKVQVLVVLAFFQFLLLANLWPIFTTDLSGAVQSQFPLPIPVQAVSGAITLVVVLLSGALGLWLLLMVTPTWASYARGWRRARKLGKSSIPSAWDESPAFGVCAVIAGVSAASVVLVLWLLNRTGYFAFTSGGWGEQLPVAVALGGGLFTFGCALARWEGGRTMVAVLLVGLLPILMAIVLAAVDESTFAHPAFLLTSLSPLGTLVLALVEPNLPPNELPELQMMRPAMWAGLCWMTIYSAVLVSRWRSVARSVAEPGHGA